MRRIHPRTNGSRTAGAGGAIALAVLAIAAGGPVSADDLQEATGEHAAQTVRRGDLGGFRVRQVLDVGRAPHQISFSANGRRAYIAAAGSDRIVEVAIPEQDDARLTVSGFREVAGTPLGVVELASGDLAVALFSRGALVRLPGSGGPPAERLATGEAPSLLVGPLPGPDGHERYLVSTEGVDQLHVLDAETFELAASFEVGDRPFPPAATADGRKAFVPGYDDGSVTVVDLWNRKVLGKVPVGDRPSGGAVLPGEVDYAVAVRGENKVVFVDTASHRVMGELAEGIGEGPFSVVISPDDAGGAAFVNNTASHDVSVIRLGANREEHRVVARVPVGEIPIVMAVHPSGATLWVGCEGSHELWVLEIPETLRGSASP